MDMPAAWARSTSRYGRGLDVLAGVGEQQPHVLVSLLLALAHSADCFQQGISVHHGCPPPEACRVGRLEAMT
jgi:hypothetical protein